jgi:heme/copper-type cytochrome/quinol oxidase subunit 2
MQRFARVLQSVCAVLFVLDMLLLVVLMQQQNPYLFPSQQTQANRWENHDQAMIWYAFAGLAVLLGIVSVISIYLWEFEQRTKAAQEKNTLPPNTKPQ